MMKKIDYIIRSITILFFILLASGCARIPQPAGYEFSTQHKMQAAHHWDILAADVAQRINDELIRQEYLETPVYVHNSCDPPGGESSCAATPFARGFGDLLTTHLVDFGVPTLTEPGDNALTVDSTVQVIFHRSGRIKRIWPGGLTTLTSGIIALYNAPWKVQALAASVIADAAGGTATVNGHYEIIISTSIVDDHRYVMRKSDIYYINDQDYRHYLQTIPLPVADIRLTGSAF